MATYVYQTIPRSEGEEPTYFEVQQSMRDAPLAHHPETGEPVKRVILGGYGLMKKDNAPPPGPCGGSCACHN